MTKYKIPESEMRECLRLGMSLSAIAQRYECSARAVSRAKRRYGLSAKPSRPYSDEEIQRAHELLAEGMPMTEIAKDLGREYTYLAHKLHAGDAQDWKSVWQEIRNSDTLLALHQELAHA